MNGMDYLTLEVLKHSSQHIIGFFFFFFFFTKNDSMDVTLLSCLDNITSFTDLRLV